MEVVSEALVTKDAFPELREATKDAIANAHARKREEATDGR